MEEVEVKVAELLPCPFCNDPMVRTSADTLQHRVQSDCPISAYAWGATFKAVAAWNTRNREVELVARALCIHNGDNPDELTAAGDPLGNPADYPLWMLVQPEARKIIAQIAGQTP